MTADVQITLSEVEQARLHHKERVIERGAQQIGEALRDIRNERLYRETHGSFEAYCEQRWGITPQHANRQIAAAEVVAVLEPMGSIPERQARELAPLRDDPDRLREVWQQANEATGGKPTAAAIRAARTPEADLIVNRETGEITDTPPKVTGLDGKEYTRPAPSAPRTPPRRTPLPDDARSAGWALRSAVERVESIGQDDRFNAHKEAVAPHLRSHLTNAIEVCQDLLDRINEQ